MSQPIVDPNDLIATGALFALLMNDDRVSVLSVDRNELVATFPFLKSPYKITVEIIPEEMRDGERSGTG